MSNGGFFVELSTQSDDVTGSCTLVTLRLPDGDKQQVIVDCGSFIEKEYKEKNESFHFVPEELDACVITHAHIDHIGRLPLLVKKGYKGKIFSTKVTAEIIPISLEDNFRIMCREAKNGKNNGGNGRLYEEIHVDQVSRKLKRCDFEMLKQITPNIEVAFLPNGHLFGAAMVYMKCSYKGYNDINILFSGDYKKDNRFFKTSKRLPFKLFQKRINLVIETTYGDSMQDEIDYVFFAEIIKAINKKQKILLPAFSLGRTQDVLLTLKRLQSEGHIPYYYNIYCDGALAKRYIKLAREGKLGIKKNKNFLPNQFYLIGESRFEKAQEERRRVYESVMPAIIVASSGNGSFGPCNTYLRNMVEQRSSTIIFTGYCTEGTLGRRLIEAENDSELEVCGETVVKKATVLSTGEFSAHAHADELLKLVDQFDNLGSVVLTHGSNEAKIAFTELLDEELQINSDKVTILKSDEVTRVDSWGLIKS